ncbi:MAG: competence/damage-inducible protein A [Myxococcota bacterium]
MPRVEGQTAAILLIGNEILSGKIDDANARYAIRELRALGVELRRILTVPDEIDEIAEAVRDLSSRFDFVFTSGGVGPTHDDLTMEGVARAFETRIVRHPVLERLLRDHYGEALEQPNLRMADVPEGAALVTADHASWPVTTCRNVYILPGVPEIFRRKFDAIKARFRGAPFYLRVAYLRLGEGVLAPLLDSVVAGWPAVRVGSYPRLDGSEYRVKVTIEGRDAAAVAAAFEGLLAQLPTGEIVRTE